jgi:light-regulated signal transduction histidine kinase (bacteriophytochrome)
LYSYWAPPSGLPLYTYYGTPWATVPEGPPTMVAPAKAPEPKPNTRNDAQPAPATATVECDGVLVGQVIRNLVSNAIDAMWDRPHGARHLQVTTESLPAHGVRISVSDRGHGIEPDVAQRGNGSHREHSARFCLGERVDTG